MTTERRRVKSNVIKRARATLGLACAFLLFAPCVACARAIGAAREDEVKESVLTGSGSLDLVRTGRDEDLTWELRLGKKSVLSIEDAPFAHFVAHFMQLNMGEVVVLATYSGGNACPAQFRVVRIVENGAQVSEEFGDCSDSPTITLKQLPDEQITFGFPGYYQLWQEREPGFVKPAPTAYVYSKGVLKELKATPAKRRGR
jgi:hypothetical protein